MRSTNASTKSASVSPSNIDPAGDLSRQWPALPGEAADIEGRTTRQRLQLLRDLNDQVKLLGLDLGLGGEMPPQGGGAPR
jgi:hypothetical protein